jgi:hypothetical protein
VVTYFELGRDKQLNEIVVAGSHDAGITGGADNVQTQGLDIGGQASAGVRVFDLRIAAATVPGQKAGSPKQAELRAFHANDKMMTNDAKSRSLGGGAAVDLTRTKFKLGAGDFGLGLTGMLRDAKAFVKSKEGGNEFLILKFDKCQNWPLIAESCVNEIGDVLLKGRANVNTAPLKVLAGKVVVLFSTGGLKEVASKYDATHGILGFKNLYDKKGGGSYTHGFAGMQYYGKGGTSVWSPFKKLAQNEKKQRKLVVGAKAAGPDVIGMMYWTTTGMFESIKKRDAKMWDTPNVAKLRKLWGAGLEEFMWERNPLSVPAGSAAIGSTRKRFMPNIVMIDFANALKCQTIRDLNDLSAADLAAMGGDA